MKIGRSATLILTAVCLLFGIAIMVQFRTESRLQAVPAADSANDLAAIAGNLYDSNTTLRAEVNQLQVQQSAQARTSGSSSQEETAAELERLRAFNGVVSVSGPGVVLTVNTSLRSVDLVDLLNEFRNAGAEAISIDDQRVVYNTGITQTGSQLYVNRRPIAAPIIFQATGPTDVLDRALARKGGMLSYLRTTYPQAQIELTTSDALTLPGYADPLPIKSPG